jgi:hypothetical protein
VMAWVERHDLRITSTTDARCAFEDAASGEPSAIIAGLERAYDAVVRLAAGEEFRMSIPARHDEDHDLVIAGPILDAIKYLRATPAEPGASPPRDERYIAKVLNDFNVRVEADHPLIRALAARSPAPAGDGPIEPGVRYAIDWIAGAAKHETPDARRFAAAMVTSLCDVLRAPTRRVTAGSFSAAAPTVGRSDQHDPIMCGVCRRAMSEDSEGAEAAGDAPREDALREALGGLTLNGLLTGLDTLTSEDHYRGATWEICGTAAKVIRALRGAVSPSAWPCECGEVADHAAGRPSGTRAASEGEA